MSLLDLHPGSGLVQPRTIRVAEGVPADVGELACCSLAQLVNDNLLAVRSGRKLFNQKCRGPRASCCRRATASVAPSLRLGRTKTQSQTSQILRHPPR